MNTFLICALWGYGFCRLFETFLKRPKIDGKIYFTYTLYVLVSSHVFVFAISVYESAARVDLTLSTLIGAIFILGAAYGRFCAIRTLGLYHSIHIEIRIHHPLIMDGPYRFLRNPYYVCNAIEVVGLPLLVYSKAGIVAAILTYWPALAWRLILEERTLNRALNGPFKDYKQRVPRLIPRSNFGVSS